MDCDLKIHVRNLVDHSPRLLTLVISVWVVRIYTRPQNHAEGREERKSSVVETGIMLGFCNTVTLDCFSITNTASIKAK